LHLQAHDARIEASMARMKSVLDAGRVVRERHGKPLKYPLPRLIVVHPDPAFLEDIEGAHTCVCADKFNKYQ
jgi:isoleucyl-tRNA synthetase